MTDLRFDHIDKVMLIGGGDLMLFTAERLREAGYNVLAVLATRHAVEILPLAEQVTLDAFHSKGIETFVAETVADILSPDTAAWRGETAMALCFGPAWVFPRAVLAAFGAGMINFNGIPVPRYLGGAHYSWQIMNGDRTGACVLQAITMDIDRGPTLRRDDFDLPADVRTPHNYFSANDTYGRRFLDTVITDMKSGEPFSPELFSDLDADRLYFPRLFTPENAWIDWSWSGAEIERFCCAFDNPYPGARTVCDGETICLRDVRLEPAPVPFHPYEAGLIVRRQNNVIWVATASGLLRIADARYANGNGPRGPMWDILKEGRRLATPPDTLFASRTVRPDF
jgi:methionyl-tRNA formyltransferase